MISVDSNSENGKSQLRLGFLTSSDPADRHAWSGTQHFMLQALEREFEEVVPLGPVSLKPLINAGKVYDRISRKLFGKGFNHLHNSWCGKAFARRFERILEKRPCDVLFAPAGGVEISHLRTELPICYLSDTSFGQISSYYPKYGNPGKRALAGGNAIEEMALNKAFSTVYPSAWAADYVVENYGVPESKVHIVPFGANLVETPDRSEVLPRKVPGTWNLLLLGVSWERKGGAIALEALEYLLAQGIDAQLTVCGCVPPVSHPQMKVIPFLDKNKPEQYRELLDLIASSHLLVLPTRAEAFGVVFCEASAYAVPSVVSATGGTTTAVTDGINGYALPYEAGGQEFGKKIAELIQNPDDYLALCESSRNQFETVLNWRSWAVRMREIIESAPRS